MATQDSNAVRRIILRTGEEVTFDAQDAPLIEALGWKRMRSQRLVYAQSSRRENRVYMHRLIMDCEKKDCIDHVDGNGLNNCRSNLRICLHAENMRNRQINKNNKSGYKGVRQQRKKWRSSIRVDGRHVHLGNYNTSVEAAMAYNNAALKLHGEFARLNEIAPWPD